MFCYRKRDGPCLSKFRYTVVAPTDELLLTVFLMIMHDLLLFTFYQDTIISILSLILIAPEVENSFYSSPSLSIFRCQSDLEEPFLLDICDNEWSCISFRSNRNIFSWNFNTLLFCTLHCSGNLWGVSEIHERIYIFPGRDNSQILYTFYKAMISSWIPHDFLKILTPVPHAK